MKKSLKFIISSFVLALAIPVIFVSNIFCAAYENTITEDNAQVIVSVNSDKTKIVSGEEFTVTFSLDKLPDNGYGLASLSLRMYYDASKVDVINITETDLANEFKMAVGPSDEDANGSEFSSARYIVFGGANGGADAVCSTGELFTVKFKAKENTYGNVKMYLESIDGFNAGAVILNSDGNPVTDKNPVPKYLKSNLDNLNICDTIEYKKGDVNRDGKVNTLDVYYAMKGIVNGTLTDEEKVILDVNGDSKANTLDINMIMRYIVGQIDSL